VSQSKAGAGRLRGGDTVHLRRQDGQVLRGVVTSVEDEAIDMVVRSEIREGERLQLSCTIPDDARYTVTVEVLETGRGRSRVRLASAWRRVQLRDFVRVAVYGVEVEVVREDPSAEEASSEKARRLQRIQQGLEGAVRKPRLVDVSAGGLRFESNASYREGEKVTVGFHLPHSGAVEARGEIVRAVEADGDHRLQNQYGVRFCDVPEATQVRIMTWVFAEQARRFREVKARGGSG
jgi:hypothetical protein